ncbi:head-tail adaptor protein [Streptomyces mirabilis]
MIGRMLNSRVLVWRLTTTPDGAGGEVTAWVQVGAYPAMVSQPSASERMLADQGQSRHSHTAHLPAGADVQRGDELRRGTQVFRVLSVFEPSRPIYVRADCEATQHQP